jgi:hypothetical protein
VPNFHRSSSEPGSFNKQTGRVHGTYVRVGAACGSEDFLCVGVTLFSRLRAAVGTIQVDRQDGHELVIRLCSVRVESNAIKLPRRSENHLAKIQISCPTQQFHTANQGPSVKHWSRHTDRLQQLVQKLQLKEEDMECERPTDDNEFDFEFGELLNAADHSRTFLSSVLGSVDKSLVSNQPTSLCDPADWIGATEDLDIPSIFDHAQYTEDMAWLRQSGDGALPQLLYNKMANIERQTLGNRTPEDDVVHVRRLCKNLIALALHPEEPANDPPHRQLRQQAIQAVDAIVKHVIETQDTETLADWKEYHMEMTDNWRPPKGGDEKEKTLARHFLAVKIRESLPFNVLLGCKVVRDAEALYNRETGNGTMTTFDGDTFRNFYMETRGTSRGSTAFCDKAQAILYHYLRFLDWLTKFWVVLVKKEVEEGVPLPQRDITRGRGNYIKNEHAWIAQKFRAETMLALPMELVFEPDSSPLSSRSRSAASTLLPRSESANVVHAFMERTIPKDLPTGVATQSSRLNEFLEKMRLGGTKCTAVSLPPQFELRNTVERTPPAENIPLLEKPPRLSQENLEKLEVKKLKIFDHRNGGLLAKTPLATPHYIYRLIDYIRRSLMHPENAARYAIMIRMNRARYKLANYKTVEEMLLREAAPSTAEGSIAPLLCVRRRTNNHTQSGLLFRGWLKASPKFTSTVATQTVGLCGAITRPAVQPRRRFCT